MSTGMKSDGGLIHFGIEVSRLLLSLSFRKGVRHFPLPCPVLLNIFNCKVQCFFRNGSFLHYKLLSVSHFYLELLFQSWHRVYLVLHLNLDFRHFKKSWKIWNCSRSWVRVAHYKAQSGFISWLQLRLECLKCPVKHVNY